MSVVQGLIFCWQKNVQYAPKLVDDLSEQQMALQIAPEGKTGANHPAWILSHLNAYLPIMQALINGETFEDPKQHPFGMLSKPEADRSIYADKDELINCFVEGHDAVTQLLTDASDSILQQDVMLPRWQAVMPTVAHALPYLMLNHENQHLGQLSAWRRIQGLPSV